MDFKSLIGKLDSIEAPEKTPQAPTLPKSVQLNEDAELRVLAGQSTVLVESELMEKAVSKSQQKAAGAALAAKRGEGAAKGASKDMMKMSTKELEKFAGTKHKGLPEKKSETKAKTTKESVELDIEEFNDKFSTMVEAAKKAPAKKTDAKGAMNKMFGGDAKDLTKNLTAKKKNEKVAEGAKPDFLDIDKDGDKKEPMKKAVADKKAGPKKGVNPFAKKESVSEVSTPTLQKYNKAAGEKIVGHLKSGDYADDKEADRKLDKRLKGSRQADARLSSRKVREEGNVAEGKSAAQKAAQEKFKAMIGKKKGDTKEDQVSEMFPGDGEYEKKYGSPIADLDSKFDKKKTGSNRTMYTRKHKAEPESDNKKRPVKESVERRLSFKQMMKLVVESGGQQQIDPTDQTLFTWAQRIAKSKLGEGMKAEVYAGMVYERMGGRFDMYDVLNESMPFEAGQQKVNYDSVDFDSLEVDGIDYRDAPEFTDAYFSDGNHVDGTPLEDWELEALTDDYDLLNQYVVNKIY